jgi:hypothetical protein
MVSLTHRGNMDVYNQRKKKDSRTQASCSRESSITHYTLSPWHRLAEARLSQPKGPGSAVHLASRASSTMARLQPLRRLQPWAGLSTDVSSCLNLGSPDVADSSIRQPRHVWADSDHAFVHQSGEYPPPSSTRPELTLKSSTPTMMVPPASSKDSSPVSSNSEPGSGSYSTVGLPMPLDGVLRSCLLARSSPWV